MRSVRSVETRVLGYVIERLERYDSSGSLASRRYEIQCPHTGSKIGTHENLRMAKRAVILHELRGVIDDQRRERERREARTQAA